MSVSSQEGRRLQAFRLSQVPLEIRLRAAKRAARGPSLASEARPEDKLFASLLDLRLERGDDDAIVVAAKRPSERVYWISAAAWERVMGLGCSST